MAALKQAFFAFNRGLVSALALGRVDLARLALSAETFRNWMPRTLGAMGLRPGLQYIGATGGVSNKRPKMVPFIRALTDTAILEFTTGALRIWINDVLLTRVSVSTAVVNGTFATNLNDWTDNDEAGATSDWASGGYMGLTGNGAAMAIRDQHVAVAVADRGVEHALRIEVHRGPVVLRVGTSLGDDSYINETELATGSHSLAFTPTAGFWIRFQSSLERQVLVNSCTVEAAGIVTLTAPYVDDQIDGIRYDQSADVVFIAQTSHTQRRVERRATRSWSIVLYQPPDGPFRNDNVSGITLTPGALSGNTTLTASASLFRATHAPDSSDGGALFRVDSDGQLQTASVTAQDQWTTAIQIAGVGNQRRVKAKREGTWSATVTLQRSTESDAGPWTDVADYTSNGTNFFNDKLDNVIAWYRLGVKTGEFTSGTVALTLSTQQGASRGICRVTGYVSATQVNVEVIEPFGALVAVDTWAEGAWSRLRGWPSAAALHESRMTWAGRDKTWASVTDVFDGFDDETEGDSGPISRSIGSGPVESIQWLLSLDWLMMGGELAEFTIRSNAMDDPLTPTQFKIKRSSDEGSANVQPATVDDAAVFAQRGGKRLFALETSDGLKYTPKNLCQLIEGIFTGSIRRIQVQRQPDTRIHVVFDDGSAYVLVYDRAENVAAWCEVETDGDIEDVVILPGASGTNEDRVYYAMERTLNGSEVRYLEKWASETECVGGTLNKQADSFVVFTNASPSVSVTGLTHLAGRSVIVWQDGVCPEDDDGFPKEYTVSAAGVVTLDTAATTGVIGLPYEGDWLSAKLGQTVNKLKRVAMLGLVLKNTHAKGLYYGPALDDDNLDPMPEIEEGAIVGANAIHSSYDNEPIEFDGDWGPDERLALKAYAPRPVTVLSAMIQGEMET